MILYYVIILCYYIIIYVIISCLALQSKLKPCRDRVRGTSYFISPLMRCRDRVHIEIESGNQATPIYGCGCRAGRKRCRL